jgi:peptidoglycan/LPS O-acetylase OafA/YrhL
VTQRVSSGPHAHPGPPGLSDTTPASPEPARPERQPRGQYPGLDGWRALAAFGVLVCHVAFAAGSSNARFWGPLVRRADVGVAVFFVLSGFLLYRPFLRALLDHEPGPAVRPYLKRRGLRIFPAYWVALAVVVGVIGVVDARPRDYVSWVFILQIYGSLATFLGPAVRNADGAIGHPLGLAWTLAVEISFYVFLPIFAALMAVVSRRLTPRRRWQLQVGVLAGMFVGSLALRVLLDQVLSLADSTFYNHWLPMQLNLFALGMGLALLSEALRRQVVPARIVALLDSRLLPWVCWGLAAASFAAVSFWVHVGVSEFYHPLGHDVALQVLYGATALLLLFPDTVRPLRRGVSPKVLAGIPLRQLGLVSYGIYLWQDIVIDQYLRRSHHRSFAAPFLPALLWVGTVTTLIATASYFVIERPALSLKHRRILPSRRAPTSAERAESR